MTGLDQADTDAIALLRLSLADIEAGYVDAARGTNTGRLGGIRRTPRTKATVNQLLDRWLEVVELETTLTARLSANRGDVAWSSADSHALSTTGDRLVRGA